VAIIIRGQSGTYQYLHRRVTGLLLEPGLIQAPGDVFGPETIGSYWHEHQAQNCVIVPWKHIRAEREHPLAGDRLQTLLRPYREQMKKYSTASTGLMKGIFTFTRIWAAFMNLGRPGSC
jgi:hypothetical protein